MDLYHIATLLGGLGFFLFGIKYMSDGLELAAGSKMKKLLEVITGNPISAFFVGLIVTTIIQSSSATTVMAIGFINAGLMTLSQAVGVIIGANVGTTITSIIIALDMSKIAPVFIFVGAVMILFSKKQNKKHIGQIILGFGILFQGLRTMSDAMSVLKTYQPFIDFIASADNPFIGVLIGTVLCTILQSSSASVGVLQALAMQNLMPIHFAAYLIIGIEIGSSTPALLASLNSKTNAKRASYVYLIFNVVGAILFVPIFMFTPLTDFITTLNGNLVAQVAIAHIIFKVVTALVMLPFTKPLVKVLCKYVPDSVEDNQMKFQFIDDKLVKNANATIYQLAKEVNRMAEIAKANFMKAANAFINSDITDKTVIEEQEQLVNYLNHAITEYLIKLNSIELQGEDSEYVVKVFHVVNDIERIGDHATNLLEKAESLAKSEVHFSDNAKSEVNVIYEKTLELLEKSIFSFNEQKLEDERALHEIENEIDSLTEQGEDSHIERLQNGECSITGGLLYVQALHDFERVGDHAFNIAGAARKDKRLIHEI